MTSPLKKYILPTLLLPSAVFAVSTLPLAVLSTQQVDIDIQEETVFTGQLRDIATPYLAAATAVSVTVGIAGFAITGWKQSKSKSSELEAQLEEQKNALNKKEEQIEELKLSPSVLEAWGLDSFLEESRREPQSVMANSMAEAPPEISVQIEEVPEPKPVMNTSMAEALPEISVQIEEVPEPQSVMNTSMAEALPEISVQIEEVPEPKPVMNTSMAEAPSEISVQIEEVPEPKPETESESPHLHVLQFPTAEVTAPASSNEEDIQTRLQQLQTQLETLQKAVSSEPQSATFQLKVPDMRQIIPQQKVAV